MRFRWAAFAWLGVMVLGGCEALLPFDDPPFADATADGMLDAAVCGNGYVEGTEECDDMAVAEDGFCPHCRIARCGDGFVRTGVEECDPAATSGCSASCLSCNVGEAQYFRESTGHCYLRFDALVVQTDGRDACYARGAYLATLKDGTEVADVLAGLAPGAADWIGLDDRGAEGSYTWVTGEPASFFNWVGGQPDNGAGTGAQNCVEATTAGTWDDVACSATIGYVCEEEPWVVNTSDGHAYRVLPGAFTWLDAETACQGSGGHLASINSAAEQAFVAPLVEGRAWIGLTDAQAEGTFTWSSGEAFGAYANWNGAEPDDGLMMEDCAFLLGDMGGVWSDVDCAGAHAALCEVP